MDEFHDRSDSHAFGAYSAGKIGAKGSDVDAGAQHDILALAEHMNLKLWGLTAYAMLGMFSCGFS